MNKEEIIKYIKREIVSTDLDLNGEDENVNILPGETEDYKKGYRDGLDTALLFF